MVQGQANRGHPVIHFLTLEEWDSRLHVYLWHPRYREDSQHRTPTTGHGRGYSNQHQLYEPSRHIHHNSQGAGIRRKQESGRVPVSSVGRDDVSRIAVGMYRLHHEGGHVPVI